MDSWIPNLLDAGARINKSYAKVEEPDGSLPHAARHAPLSQTSIASPALPPSRGHLMCARLTRQYAQRFGERPIARGSVRGLVSSRRDRAASDPRASSALFGGGNLMSA